MTYHDVRAAVLHLLRALGKVTNSALAKIVGDDEGPHHVPREDPAPDSSDDDREEGEPVSIASDESASSGDVSQPEQANLHSTLSQRLSAVQHRLGQLETDAEEEAAWLAGHATELMALYEAHFDRLFPGAEGTARYEREVRPLLSVLVAAREPLSAEEVAAALVAGGRAEAAGLDPLDPAPSVRRRMKQVTALYPERRGEYVPHHASVTEWLASEVGHAAAGAPTYAVDQMVGHRLLAAAGRAAWGEAGANGPGYALRHLPSHLLKTGQWEEAYDLLTTLAYVEAKVEAGHVWDLAEDFMAAAQAAPRGQEAKERILRVLGRALTHETAFLRRHPECAFQVCWNRGWWTDAEAARHYFEVEEDAPGDYQPPWVREGPKVSGLLEQWRQERAPAPWVRRMVPPRDLFSVRHTVLREHGDGIEHMAWSPSGDRLASASGGVRVLDPTGQAEPLILGGHTGEATHVAWSPSGDRLASVSRGGTVQVWESDLSSKPIVLESRPNSSPSDYYDYYDAAHVAWSPSGDRLASSLGNGIIRVWHLSGETAYCVLYQKGHWYSQQKPTHLAWSPSGERLAGTYRYDTVRVWDFSGEHASFVLSGYKAAVVHVAWSPSGDRLASASWDGTVRVCDLASQANSLVLDGHEEQVVHVAWSPSGDRLASVHREGVVRVWDLASQADPLILHGPKSLRYRHQVCRVAWAPSGDRLASPSGDGVVCMWDLSAGTEPFFLRGHEGPVVHVAWSPSGDRLASASGNTFLEGDDDTVRVWDLLDKADPLVPREHESKVTRLAWSPSGRRLATASKDKTVRVWDPMGQADLLVLRGHEQGTPRVAWLSLKDRLISVSDDCTVRLWDTRTGVQLDCYEDNSIPESFYQEYEDHPSFACCVLPTETRIEHRHDESPVAWFEASGYEYLTPSPGGAPAWAARSGSSVLVFALEDAPG